MGPVEHKQRWLPNFLAGTATYSGVGYLAAAYVISRWLTRPSRGRPAATPGDLGLAWEPAGCHTADRHRLAGWVVTPERPVATVLLCHGMRQNRAHLLSRIAFLSEAGYRCVAFDHRAHGESTGRVSSFGYHERLDVLAAHAWCRERWPGEPLAALGQSMGAAALCYAGDAARFDALVLESLYTDIRRAFRNRTEGSYPPAFRRLERGIFWITEWRLGVRVPQLAPVQCVGRLAPTPVLLVNGDRDRHSTPEEAVRLFESCGEPRELWIVPGAGHGDVCETGGQAYRERVLSFLGRHLRVGAGPPGAVPFRRPERPSQEPPALSA